MNSICVSEILKHNSKFNIFKFYYEYYLFCV